MGSHSEQTGELPGAKWSCSIEWQGLKLSDARLMKAFLASLRGSSGRFYIWDVSHETPSGTAGGTPLVKGTGQTGMSVITDGWNANQSALLKIGDYIGIGGELKIITVDASSNGSGEATLVFEPPLRSSPADNSAIVITKPPCIMRLVDDQQDKIKINPPTLPNFTLNAVEIF